ncbi:hypothetical protein Asp14428_56610 [Actinoplanes sp. NBRC 14428]|uniref:Ribosomally synthesized peptide with SipW-like signal peptide n=1 Tax=Pseudosporangium ferrugineum TaxID=439699 RepID=A0A2T0RDL5_9ACTN|nr:hypothetical protein [Pseudosporangium ferrugineum]PRY19257.1 hypothetical protein CLV70_13620 [Pseudosporangium ferrugineum]BCJ54186.1 hypothetical protein Asp14428_56610 [Actinoplanes sp. NBRC 14428]
MRKLSRRSTTVAVTSIVAVGAAGAAWAAWSLSGSGTAEAKAGSVVNLKVTHAGLAGGLTPGNATTVLLTVENRNAFPVRITDIDLTGLDSPQEGCDAAANVEVVNDAALPERATVPAGSEKAPATAEIAWSGPLRMNDDPADACQGAPFTFNVRLDAQSAAS